MVGRVRISGSKNATLPLMCATILNSGRNHLSNIPQLRDVNTMGRLLTTLGSRVNGKTGETIIDNTPRPMGVECPYELVKTMRASVLALGPLVAKRGMRPGQPARGMRHRRAAHRAAPQGPGGHGGQDHAWKRAMWWPRPRRLKGSRDHL